MIDGGVVWGNILAWHLQDFDPLPQYLRNKTTKHKTERFVVMMFWYIPCKQYYKLCRSLHLSSLLLVIVPKRLFGSKQTHMKVSVLKEKTLFMKKNEAYTFYFWSQFLGIFYMTGERSPRTIKEVSLLALAMNSDDNKSRALIGFYYKGGVEDRREHRLREDCKELKSQCRPHCS